MGKIRRIIIIIGFFGSILLFIFGIYLLNSINYFKNGNVFSELLNLNEYSEMEESINILLLGSDNKAGNSIDTDSIMLINFNPNNNELNLLSIPNNTKVKYKEDKIEIKSVYKESGMKTKGCVAIRSVVEELLNTEIDYYILFKSDVFCRVIDEMGGISYDIPYNLIYKDPKVALDINLKKGNQNLNGEQSENLIKFIRPMENLYENEEDLDEVNDFYTGSDLKRIEIQHEFIRQLIKQKSDVTSTDKFQNIIGIIFNKLETDFKLDTFIQIGSNVKNINEKNVRSFSIEVDENNDFEFTGKIIDNDHREILSVNKIVEEYFSGIKESKKEDEAKKTDSEGDIIEETETNYSEDSTDDEEEQSLSPSKLDDYKSTNVDKTTKTPVQTTKTNDETSKPTTSIPETTSETVEPTVTSDPVTTEATATVTSEPTASDVENSN